MEKIDNYTLINYIPRSSDIGIVIVASTRKEYIIDAIKSALRQNLDHFTFIVTVVKNFLDDEIDEFINKNNVNNVYTSDLSLGYKILLGTILTNARIICFLEDDDFFMEHKLTYVYSRFKENRDLIYYHNSVIPVDSENRVLTEWRKQENLILMANSESNLKILLRLLKYGGGRNLSSISISRDIILKNAGMFPNSTYNIDYGILLLALSSGRPVLNSKDQLTVYRIHSSATHMKSTSHNNFIDQKCRIQHESIITLHNLSSFINSENPHIKGIYNLMLDQYIIRSNFFCGAHIYISMRGYLSLFRYQYNIKNYLIYLILILFRLKKLEKLRKKLLEHYKPISNI